MTTQTQDQAMAELDRIAGVCNEYGAEAIRTVQKALEDAQERIEALEGRGQEHVGFISEGCKGYVQAEKVKPGDLLYLAPPAPAVPDGWKLVPELMPLDKNDLELLIGQAGIELSNDQVDELCEVILFIGAVAGDTSTEDTYGLSAGCAECLEEGFIPLVEFDPMLAAIPQPPAASDDKRDPFIRERAQLEQEWCDLRRMQRMCDIPAAEIEANKRDAELYRRALSGMANAIKRQTGIVPTEELCRESLEEAIDEMCKGGAE